MKNTIKTFPPCKRCGKPNMHSVTEGKITVSGVDVMCPTCQKETGKVFFSQLKEI